MVQKVDVVQLSEGNFINLPGAVYQWIMYVVRVGQALAQLVEALHYKPEGHGFNSRWCHWNFSLHNPSSRTMTPG
jgi:hypothetical protein